MINGVTALKRVITIIKEGGSVKSYLMSDTLRPHTAGEFKLSLRK